MLPIRCIFEANCVVITLPFASEICRNNEPATTDSLIDLPGDRTFVESLIILDRKEKESKTEGTLLGMYQQRTSCIDTGTNVYMHKSHTVQCNLGQ